MLKPYSSEKIKLSVDNQYQLTCSDIKKVIDKIIDDEYFANRCELTLYNKNCERKFILKVKIPDPDELSVIDKKFNAILCKKEPALDDVTTFANECRQFNRSKQYYDGLCDYVHGYLIKQHPEITTKANEKYL